MSATATPTFKPLSMADSCLLSLPSIFASKPPYQCLSIPPKPIKLHLSYSSHSLSSLSLKPKTHFSSFISFVAQTSDWTQREEEGDTTITLSESEQEEGTWENQPSGDVEAQVSDWESNGEDEVVEADGSDGESSAEGGFEESETEEGFVEPPEDAKIFVGNLPYDVDSQKLAMLFEQAGTVEIAEV